MTWEGVYQSVKCCELPESFTVPCQSSTVPQVQIGVRPIVRRMAAVSAMSARAIPNTSGGRTPCDALARRVREGVPAISDPRIHPPRIENAGRIEGGLDAAGQRHQSLGLRLEHVERRANLGGRTHEGGVAAESPGGFAQDGGTCVAVERGRDPEEPAAPIVEPLRIERLRDLGDEVGPLRRRGGDAP